MKVLRFFSLLFSALSAGLVLAHVLEMRAKMRMTRRITARHSRSTPGGAWPAPSSIPVRC
jgi:hypothetical protein